MKQFDEFNCQTYKNSILILKNYDTIQHSNDPIKLAIFDLDHTLIRPKSFKIFPINDQDWRWVYQEVLLKLQNFIKKKFFIFIISNQLGISLNKVSSDMLCQRIANAFKAINDDFYRKPSIGCFQYIKCEFFGKKQIIDYKKSFYTGDSYGKDSTKSSVDLLFALNCKLQFKTPENIFLKHDNLNLQNIKIYDPYQEVSVTKQNFLKKKLQKYIGIKKICFIIIGAPYSGKTQFIKQTFDLEDVEFFNLRSGNEIQILKKNFEDKFSNKKTIVIELSQKRRFKRQQILEYINSQNFYIYGIYLKRSLNFCLHSLSFQQVKKKIIKLKSNQNIYKFFIYLVIF